eukprot:jgi/Botrbrau1/8329/Bobra.0081s0018.1
MLMQLDDVIPHQRESIPRLNLNTIIRLKQRHVRRCLMGSGAPRCRRSQVPAKFPFESRQNFKTRWLMGIKTSTFGGVATDMKLQNTLLARQPLQAAKKRR